MASKRRVPSASGQQWQEHINCKFNRTQTKAITIQVPFETLTIAIINNDQYAWWSTQEPYICRLGRQ